jgi:hypothetical protein
LIFKDDDGNLEWGIVILVDVRGKFFDVGGDDGGKFFVDGGVDAESAFSDLGGVDDLLLVSADG